MTGSAPRDQVPDPWAAPVRGLLLDIDDTLVDTRGAMGAALRAAAAVAWPGVPATTGDAFADRYYADPAGHFDAYTRGERTFAGMRRARADEAAAALDLPPLDETTFAAFEAAYRVAFAGAQLLFEDVEPLLTAAAAAGVRVGLLTNSGAAVTTDKLTAIGMAGRCPVVVTTDTLGVGKPDPRIFAYAREQLAVEAPYVVVVGDTLGTDVLGARRSGLRAAWLQRPGLPEPRDAGWGTPVTDPGVRVVGMLAEVAQLIGLPGLRGADDRS